MWRRPLTGCSPESRRYSGCSRIITGAPRPRSRALVPPRVREEERAYGFKAPVRSRIKIIDALAGA